MEQLTASAKPFIPQSLSQDTSPKKHEINPTAPIFIPKAVVIAPGLSLSSAEGSNSDSGAASGAEKRGKTSGKNSKTKSGFEKLVKPTTEGKKSSRRGRASRDEVRELENRLREKEEKLRELEERQSQEQAAQSVNFAKRVDEEVSQKLFNASVLSNMYHNSLSSEKPKKKSPTSKGSKEQAKLPSKSQKPQTKSGAPSPGKRKESQREKGVGFIPLNGDKIRNSRERINTSSSPIKIQSKSPTDRLTVLSEIILEMTPEEIRERDKMRKGKERVIMDRRSATIEADIKDILNNIRKSKPLLLDYCLLGIANGAPAEFVEKCTALDEICTSQLVREANPVFFFEVFDDRIEVVGNDGPVVKWARKLYDLRMRQVGLIRQVIDKAEKKEGADNTTLDQIRQVFLAEVENNVNKLALVHDSLQKILSNDFSEESILNIQVSNPSKIYAQEMQVRSSMQVILIALADMCRLQLLYSTSEVNSEENNLEDSSHISKQKEIELLLQRALTISPRNGAPYELLSKLAMNIKPYSTINAPRFRRKKDVFLSAYFLARGLGAEVPLLTAREALLDTFEEAKSLSERLENVTALSRLNLKEHIRRFQIHILAAVGVAYSRTGADKLGFHLSKARRHVGTLLQLLSTGHLSEQNRGGKGEFASYDQKDFIKQSSSKSSHETPDLALDPIIVAQCRALDESLCQALMIILCLIGSIGDAHKVFRMFDDSKWSGAYANWINQNDIDESWSLEDHVAIIDAEDRRVMENRHALQRMHKVQSIPGLMDLIAVVVSILCSVLNKESIRNVLNAEKREDKKLDARSLATTRMLTLFFEWLESHPEYHAAVTMLGEGDWAAVEADLPQLMSRLQYAVSNNDNKTSSVESLSPRAIISDDVALRGFVPLQTTVKKHTATLDEFQTTFEASRNLSAPTLFHESLEVKMKGNIVTFEDQTSLWVQEYATRICQSIRNLCNHVVVFGEMTFHMNSSGKREVLLPIDNELKRLTVISYNPVSPTQDVGQRKKHGLGSTKTKSILSQEEFMSGVVQCEGNTTSPQQEETEPELDISKRFEDDDMSSLSSDNNISNGVAEINLGVVDDDLDLDLNELVLEFDQKEVDYLPPPPGFSALPEQEESFTPLHTTTDYSKEEDEDFAAMCAALLTVPQTESKEPSSQSFSLENSIDDGVKGGLLNIKVPDKAQYSSSSNKDGAEISTLRNRSYEKKSWKSASSNLHGYPFPNRFKATADIPLIVVDAPNVAMRHGLNSKFSCKGIQLAMNFFHTAGHKVIAFLPDYYLNYERVGELRRLASLNIGDVRASQIPDDIDILQQLVQEGFVIGTPSQDYDDSYCITYAQKRSGYIVSNDMYRDHYQRIENKDQREQARHWIKSHVISYTFVGDEFLPNPDATIFPR